MGVGIYFVRQYVRWSVGLRFPSINLHKKLSQVLVEEGGASSSDPALLPHFQSLFLQT